MFSWLISVVVSTMTILNSVATFDEGNAIDVTKRDTSDLNIAFDLPDLAVITETTSGITQLEAYKSVNNDRILRNVSTAGDQVSQLFWVSVGQPSFVMTPNPNKPNSIEIFHSSNYGFHTYIQMLTSAHRRVLAATARKKYKVAIDDGQIVNLILSKFECSLTMIDEAGKKYLLKGNVFDFRNFPLRINFPAPPKTMERKLFSELLQGASDFEFMCEMTSTGKLMKTNTLTITSQQQQLIGIEEKLFGPAFTNGSNNAFVTRDQMTELSSEMYTSLNIVEDYQMSEGQFSDAFVEGMINQIATEQFKQVPIDTVLASLSKYGFDIGEDLKPDVIKKDMGSIMTIEKKDEKSRIILDEANYKKFEDSKSKSFGIGGKAFKVSASLNWARSNSKSTTTDTKSLNDQLSELNTVSQKDVQWDIVGTKVVPKSLSVAQLSRSKLGKTLSFSRVRVQSFQAPFDRQFAIYTNRPTVSISFLEALSSRVDIVEAETRRVDAKFTSSIENVDRQLSHAIQNVNKQLSTSIQTSSKSFDQRVSTVGKEVQQMGTSLKSLWGSHSTLSSKALKRCQLCFIETAGTYVCKGARNTCTPFTNSTYSGGWTLPFTDNTDNKNRWCTYQWAINCYA